MTHVNPSEGKHIGLTIDLGGVGKVELTQVLKKNSETTIYRTALPGIVVKVFDLSCGKPDEVSYGPYMSFTLEAANWEDIRNIEELIHFVPAYYGANLDSVKKYAFIAMEYLEGQDLKSWCEDGAAGDFQSEWVDEFKEAVYEALSILRRFHKYGIILIDFKPDNIIRLSEKGIKFVDLGAFFTPRHSGAVDKYVYSATPDYAELLIDAMNVQSGVPPAETSDIFATGVALFEMATGSSRLQMSGETADEMLSDPAIFLFRDSQIRDWWQSYPHLKDVFPMLETQLRERRILFAELWHLLKGYLASKMPDWDSLAQEQRDEMLLATGTTFILEQLPPRLQWLAGPIAQATVLRSLRLKSVSAVMKLLENPVSDDVKQDIESHNCCFQYFCDLERSVEFVKHLNTWQARANPKTGHWAIAGPVACAELLDSAPFIFLKQADSGEAGHKYFLIVDDLEADDFEEGKMTLWHLRNDHFTWLA